MGEGLRVLIVEDSEDDSVLLVRALQRAGYEVTWRRVETAEEMRAALTSEAWDLVVTDYSMLRFSAPEALNVLKAARLDLPFLIVSGTVAEDVAVEAMRAGAHDYLLKGQLKRLVPVIERELHQAASRRAGRRAEEQYRDLVTFAPIGIFRATRDGAFVTVNAAYARLLGYDDPAEVVGLSLLRDIYFDGADRERLIAEIERRGGAAASEVRLRRRDGSPVWVRQESRAIIGRSGDIEFFEDFVHDIQRQKAAESALRQSEERFRRSFTVSPIGMSLSEASSGRFIDVNERFAETFGYRREELIGRTSLEIGLWADPEQREQTLRMTRRAIPIREREVRMRAKDGELRYVLGSLEPLQLGEEQMFLSVFQDITERRRGEESIRRLLSAVQQAGSIIYMTDPEGAITYVNPAFERTYGYSKEEVLGQTPRILKSGIHGEDYYQSFWKRILAGESVREEFVNRRRDGQLVTVEAFVSPVLDAEHERIGFIAVQEDVTDHKRAEEALRQSEERFRRSFSVSPIAMTLSRPATGLILDANESLARMLGYGPDELLGRTSLELGIWADPRQRERVVADLEASIPVREREVQLRTKTGDIRHVLDSVEPLDIGNERVILSAFNDVTQRRQAEEALRASEERYRLLFESNPQPMWVFDEKTLAFLAVNESACRHYGYSREEFLRMTIRDIRPLEDVPALLDQIASETRDLQDSGVWRHRRRDGTGIEVEIVSHPLTFDGRPAQLVLAIDVTERRLAERRVQERTTYLNSLVENSPFAILMLDARHRIQIANPAFVRLFGYRPEELQGLDPDSLISPVQEDLAAEALSITADCLAGRPMHVTTRRRHKDGKLVDVDLYGVPLLQEGHLIGVYAIYADMTERNNLELQLQQAQKMEAVGQLAGGVAHDFNNVLTAILGYSDLLAMQLGEGNPMQESVDEIRRAGERAASLTRQLLAFSRRQVLEPRVLDPNELIRNVEKMLRRLIGEDLALATRLDPSIGRIRADPGQVEQVLLNLAVNARDAMPRGGTLTIETQNAELDEAYAREHVTVKPGSYVMIAVTDTGTGMDAEVKAHIFEPFFTTKEKGKGTGLGLATVYGIVKQSGGYIWAYSEPGRGTSFKIYLPRVESPAERLSRKEPGQVQGGTETILLVEDEQPVRKLARAILESHGYTVLEADGADQALDVAKNHSGPLELLLTDVVMPKMGGSDLATMVHGQRPGIKVLYMSGYTDDAIVRQGLVGEGAHFLQKPFTPDALASKVRESLDAGESR